MLNSLIFSAQTTAPIFILILVGMVLKKTGIVDVPFISSSSALVFRLALPVMLFQRMANVQSIPGELYIGIGVQVAVTLAVFIGTWAAFYRLDAPSQGSLVQGSFRGNIVIIGLAVIESRLGGRALATAAVFIVIILPLYIFLSIVVLSRSRGKSEVNVIRKVLGELVRNPLFGAIILGLPFGLLKIEIPAVLNTSMDYVSRLTLPLALIGSGASLNLKGLMSRKKLWSTASAIKLLAAPALAWFLASLFSIRGEMLDVIVISASCPTAVASFSMAEAMGADSELAGEIISATTLFSMATMTFWLGMLAAAA